MEGYLVCWRFRQKPDRTWQPYPHGPGTSTQYEVGVGLGRTNVVPWSALEALLNFPTPMMLGKNHTATTTMIFVLCTLLHLDLVTN